LKLETNIKQLKKLSQSSRKQSLFKNSNKLLETSTILKKFFKLLIDLNKLQFKY